MSGQPPAPKRGIFVETQKEKVAQAEAIALLCTKRLSFHSSHWPFALHQQASAAISRVSLYYQQKSWVCKANRLCRVFFFFFIYKGSRSSCSVPLWLRSGSPALVVAPGLHLRSPLAPPLILASGPTRLTPPVDLATLATSHIITGQNWLNLSTPSSPPRPSAAAHRSRLGHGSGVWEKWDKLTKSH